MSHLRIMAWFTLAERLGLYNLTCLNSTDFSPYDNSIADV